MTIVLGIKDYDFSILATDREESGWLKTDVCKIAVKNCRTGWNVGLAGAGHGRLVDYASQEIGHALDTSTVTTKSEIKETIRGVLEHIYSRNILPTGDLDRYSIGFNISIQNKNEIALFTTEMGTVREVPEDPLPRDFALIGCGDSFAASLLNKYFGVLSLRGAVLLALYTVRQTKKHVREVGGGTDMLISTSKGRCIPLAPSIISPVEVVVLPANLDSQGLVF